MRIRRPGEVKKAWFLLSILAGACAPDGGDREVRAAARPDEEKLLHLEARFGRPGSLWGEASYKVKRAKGQRLREMEVEVEGAQPGSQYTLSLDGFELGTMYVNRKGEAEFEVSEEDEQLFPESFPEPQKGSVFVVGDLMELRLDDLIKLTELEVEFHGEDALSGKVGFKIEQLGDVITREFKVKVEHAPPRTVHIVTLDGVDVGDLSVDLEGKGKFTFSTKRPPSFPETFPELHAGSAVQIGDIFRGELQDVQRTPSG